MQKIKYEILKSELLDYVEKYPDAKKSLKELFPDAFREEVAFLVGGIYYCKRCKVYCKLVIHNDLYALSNIDRDTGNTGFHIGYDNKSAIQKKLNEECRYCPNVIIKVTECKEKK